MKFIHYYESKMYLMRGIPFFSFWELRYLFGICTDSFYYMKDQYGIVEHTYFDVNEDLLWEHCAPGIVEDLVTGKIYRTTESYLGCSNLTRSQMALKIPKTAFMFTRATRREYINSTDFSELQEAVASIKGSTLHRAKTKYTLEDFTALLDVCDRNGGSIFRSIPGFKC